MNIAAVFIVYFGIKETQFHRDTGVWKGQYRPPHEPYSSNIPHPNNTACSYAGPLFTWQ